MKKQLITLVVLLAAIVPSLPSTALDLNKVAAGLSILNAFRGVSDSEVNRVGRQLDEGLVKEYGTTDDELARVQKVADRLGAKEDVKVLRASKPNAMSVPGHLYITDGLLQKLSDDELAGVMAHELAHQRHSDSKSAIKRSRVAQGLGGALALSGAKDDVATSLTIAAVLSFFKYSRDQEYSADRDGAKYAYEAGYDPNGLANALRKLDGSKGAEILSTHPENDKRIARLDSEWGKVGKVIPKRSTAPQTITRTRDSAKSHLEMRRITVEFKFDGDAYRLSEWFPGFFTNQVNDTGLIKVEVSGEDYDKTVEAQDRINDSGRYSSETRNQVPKGKMHAPTDRYVVTVRESLKRLNIGARFSSNVGIGANINDYVTCGIELHVTPWDLKAGELQKGWNVKGKTQKGLDGTSVYGYSWRRGLDFNVYISDIEKTLEGKAAKSAADEFAKAFANRPPEPLDDEQMTVLEAKSATGRIKLLTESDEVVKITITSGKSVKVGDIIAFYRDGKVSAKYVILIIDGQTVKVRTITEKVRPTVEPFNINPL